ncbi:MAG: ABC transporter ATP-binding protein [Deltaproteobacteria bacterium]|nr:MAG: ABC transporter ATP-binding protein [Deltaproteobacteria bacterium]
MTATARLEIAGLQRRYGSHRAVDHLDLTLPGGCVVGLIGPNGAGKTTTMRLVAGHQAPDAGTIRVDGVDIAGRPDDARLRVALTPQDISLLEHLTPEETLRFVGRLRGLSDSEVSVRTERWLDAAHLQPVRQRLVRELSGGMKRKLAMGCAMLAPVPLVLLDEAFVGLDPESTHSLEAELRDFAAAGGTIVLSSHLLDLVHRLSDIVIMMRAGRLVARWTRAELDALVPSPHADLTALYLQHLGEGRTTGA